MMPESSEGLNEALGMKPLVYAPVTNMNNCYTALYFY